ncbi:MAG: hypothetical protein HY791_36495 [Deltaproteobacteria bacterium]|nr:hypothetical protein [Deltaproteobacteria bacterium]
MAALALLLVLSADRGLVLEPHADGRVTAGAEWDSNANRVFGEGPGDAATRAELDLALSLDLTARDRIFVSAVVGVKRFFEVEDEDVVVQDFTLTSSHELGPFELGATGRLRSSHAREASRDFRLLGAGGFVTWRNGSFELRLKAEGSRSDLYSIRELSYGAPTLGVAANLGLGRRWMLQGSIDLALRHFDAGILQKVQVPQVDEPTLTYSRCDGSDGIGPPACNPSLRRDQLLELSVRATYRSKILVSLEPGVRIDRSNSELEDFVQYRITGNLTAPLPYGFMLNFLGSIRLDRSDTYSEVIALLIDENLAQNRLEAGISRVVASPISIDLRYALYTNQSTSDVDSYVHQTVYLGLCATLPSADTR